MKGKATKECLLLERNIVNIIINSLTFIINL